MPTWFTFIIIGLVGGISTGFFGMGGGMILIPALIYSAGFSQHMATGTTLAVMLPPIGLAAAFEYYRLGNVDVKAAAIIAVMMFVGAWLGAHYANQMRGPQLQLIFGVFVCFLGVYLVYGACNRIDCL
jgi:uncharacterized membrane protein YfcA